MLCVVLQVALVCEVRSSHVFDVLEPFLQDATLVSGARLGRPLFGALVAALLDGLGKNIALVKVQPPQIDTTTTGHRIYTQTRHIFRFRGIERSCSVPLTLSCAFRFLGLVCSVIATTR